MSQEDERSKRSRLKQIPTQANTQVDPPVATNTRERHGKRRRTEDSGKSKNRDRDRDNDEARPTFSKADFDRDGYCIVHGVLDAGASPCFVSVFVFVFCLLSFVFVFVFAFCLLSFVFVFVFVSFLAASCFLVLGLCVLPCLIVSSIVSSRLVLSTLVLLCCLL